MDVDTRGADRDKQFAAGSLEPSASLSAAARPPLRLWPVCAILGIAALCFLMITAWPLLSGREMQSGIPWALTYGTSALTLLSLFGWLLLFSRLAAGPKWSIFFIGLSLITVIAVSVRVNFTGDLKPIFSFRWHGVGGPKIFTDGPRVDLKRPTPNDVPGFLGPDRRPDFNNVRLDPDWTAHPPRELWRAPVGEGFSAFAVVGDFAVTQQQAEDDELVVCYEWRTGRARWKHADRIYFSSSLGGVGPRATPMIDEGRVYTMGATGILNCLDGHDGRVLWTRNVREENQARNLEWGFSCSPLIVDNLVVVSAGISDPSITKRDVPHYALIAYDKQTGKPQWHGGADDASYCSPTLATIGGVRQILIANAGSVTSHDLKDGHVLWEFPIQRDLPTVSQVVALKADQVFFSKGYGAGSGVRQISRDAAGQWSWKEVWTRPNLLRTKFTNVVIRDGYAYGLNDGFLECVSLDKGVQRWTARRHREVKYEHGQVLLVGDLLLVQTEQGDVALVEAVPKAFRELAHFTALTGRTWNCPVLVGNYLLTRNDREAACFELPMKTGKAAGE